MHCKFDIINRMHKEEIQPHNSKQLTPTKPALISFKGPKFSKYISIRHVRIPLEPCEQKNILWYNAPYTSISKAR